MDNLFSLLTLILVGSALIIVPACAVTLFNRGRREKAEVALVQQAHTKYGVTLTPAQVFHLQQFFNLGYVKDAGEGLVRVTLRNGAQKEVRLRNQRAVKQHSLVDAAGVELTKVG